jgi:GT2 family glycosyltransferase
MQKITVIILNFKVKEQTLKCIDSVKKSTYKNIEIIVVDNNSSDGIEEAVKELGVQFIQTGANLGYTGGNNIAIKKALSSGADYIFILNPDTIVDKKCLENLSNALKVSNVGIVGPKIYFSDSKKIWYAGGILDKANVIGSHRGVDEIDNGQYDEEIETDFVSGAAMLVKREVFEAIGLFDDRFFLYYEDNDLCQRARLKEFKIMYIPSAVVYHANAQSTGLGSPVQDYYITRNRMLFASKFLPLRTRFALFREALRNTGSPMRRLALFDFLTGNLGKGGFNA